MEDLRQICVADREHGRIQCFDMDTGEFIRSMQIPQVGSTVYGIDYAQYKGKNIYNLLYMKGKNICKLYESYES